MTSFNIIPISNQKIVQFREDTCLMNFNKNNNYFGQDNLINLLTKTVSCQKYSKTINPHQERLLYSALLEHAINFIGQKIAEPTVNIRKNLTQQRQFISQLVSEIIELFNRECKEKASLFQLICTYFKESLRETESACEKRMKDLTLEYCQNLELQKKESELQISELQNRLNGIQKQNQQKWKTFYMIVKDNRVLRRQKGKLMRTLYEQKIKLTNVHEEMILIAKDNQKNKLLANYAQQNQSLQLFLSNYNSINKLEQFMKNYPKYSKKILQFDLQKLEVIQNDNIDQKISYIMKTAKQSQQIFDEYEDLIDVSRPNKLIFNNSTQTSPFDVGEQTQIASLKQILKIATSNSGTQTPHRNDLSLDSHVIDIDQLLNLPKRRSESIHRRRGVQINSIQDIQRIDAIRHFKQNYIVKRVVNVKLIVKKMVQNNHRLISHAISFSTINDQNDGFDYPALRTSHRLQIDIRRSKDILKRQSFRRSSKLFNSQNIDAIPQKIQPPESDHRIINENTANPFFFADKEDTPKQKSKIKYLISMPNPRLSTDYQRSESRTNLTNTAIETTLQKKKFMQRTDSMGVKKLTKKTRNNIKDINNKINRVSKNSERQGLNMTGIITKKQKGWIDTSQNQQGEAKVRKSGFAIQHSSKNRINTEPEQTSSTAKNQEPLTFDSTFSKPKQKLMSKVSIVSNTKSMRNSHQTARVSQFTQINQQKKITQLVKKERVRRTTTIQQKSVNILSPQNLRLAEKIVKSIYNRRKQIIQGKLNFQTFLKSFMVTQYGSHLHLSLHNRFVKGLKNPILDSFDLLLNMHESNGYLQHIFRLFAKMLVISGGESILITSQRGRQIYKQLIKIYVKDNLAQDLSTIFYNQIEQSNSQNNLINISLVFNSVQNYIKNELQKCQLYQFLQMLLPKSQNSLNFQQIKQLLGLFIFDRHYIQHLLTLKQYSTPQISVHILCFYAIKQQWSPLIKIKQFINDYYQKSFGFYKQQAALDYLWANQVDRIVWFSRIVEQHIKTGKSMKQQNQITLIKFMQLLLLNYYLQKNNPLAQNLYKINTQCSILAIKSKFDLFSF